MPRRRHLVVCLLLSAAPVAHEDGTAQGVPRFEVASIRPTARNATSGPPLGYRITGTQVRWSGLSLTDYIAMAYSLDPPQIIAPEWAREVRFEVAATLPPDTPREQIPLMIRTLLAERFQLKVHEESRQFPIYALTVGKGGLKIKRTPVDPNTPPLEASETTGSGSNAGVVITMGAGTWTLANNKLEVRNLTMADVALGLTRFSERKTIDATDITDRVDFTLDLSQEDYGFAMMRAALNNGYALAPQALKMLDSAPSNLLGQYIAKTGLVLEERNAPLPVIVVDVVSKTATEN